MEKIKNWKPKERRLKAGTVGMQGVADGELLNQRLVGLHEKNVLPRDEWARVPSYFFNDMSNPIVRACENWLYFGFVVEF